MKHKPYSKRFKTPGAEIEVTALVRVEGESNVYYEPLQYDTDGEIDGTTVVYGVYGVLQWHEDHIADCASLKQALRLVKSLGADVPPEMSMARQKAVLAKYTGNSTCPDFWNNASARRDLIEGLGLTKAGHEHFSRCLLEAGVIAGAGTPDQRIEAVLRFCNLWSPDPVINAQPTEITLQYRGTVQVGDADPKPYNVTVIGEWEGGKIVNPAVTSTDLEEQIITDIVDYEF